MSRIREHIARTPWAITEEAMETICDIADRLNDEEGFINAIQRREGERLATPGAATVVNGVAVIPVTGPMFRRANLMTAISGATSTEILAKTIGEALADPAVNSIVLDVDSPGGEVNGSHELSELIFSARDEKPLTAFVSNRAESAALWVATAAAEVVASPTSRIGSLGAVLGVVEFKGRGDARRLEMVSSQSPKKRLDPFSIEGQADLQSQVDAIGAVFVKDVARNRGVDEETALADFGQGATFVGEAAFEAGLVDRIGTLESVIQDHRENHSRRDGGTQSLAAGGDSTSQAGDSGMDKTEEGKTPAAQQPVIDRAFLNANHSDLVTEIHGEGCIAGADAERERLLAIEAIEARGLEQLKAELKLDANCSAGEAALRVLAAQKERSDAKSLAHIDALKATEAKLEAPGPAVTGDADEVATAVAAIMGAGS